VEKLLVLKVPVIVEDGNFTLYAGNDVLNINTYNSKSIVEFNGRTLLQHKNPIYNIDHSRISLANARVRLNDLLEYYQAMLYAVSQCGHGLVNSYRRDTLEAIPCNIRGISERHLAPFNDDCIHAQDITLFMKDDDIVIGTLQGATAEPYSLNNPCPFTFIFPPVLGQFPRLNFPPFGELYFPPVRQYVPIIELNPIYLQAAVDVWYKFNTDIYYPGEAFFTILFDEFKFDTFFSSDIIFTVYAATTANPCGDVNGFTCYFSDVVGLNAEFSTNPSSPLYTPIPPVTIPLQIDTTYYIKIAGADFESTLGQFDPNNIQHVGDYGQFAFRLELQIFYF